jgi:hypothetical protein
MFSFGMDHTVVNVIKEAIWIREAAIPNSANTTRPNPKWMVQEMFGGEVPKKLLHYFLQLSLHCCVRPFDTPYGLRE